MPCCPIGCAVPRPACTRSQGGRIQHTTWTGQSLDPAFVAPLPLFQRLEISVLADLLSGTSVARMPARTRRILKKRRRSHRLWSGALSNEVR
jgi:hypothetical protein